MKIPRDREHFLTNLASFLEVITIILKGGIKKHIFSMPNGTDAWYLVIDGYVNMPATHEFLQKAKFILDQCYLELEKANIEYVQEQKKWEEDETVEKSWKRPQD